VRADVTGIDPHRPTIDDVTFACGTCASDVGAVDESMSWRCAAGSNR